MNPVINMNLLQIQQFAACIILAVLLHFASPRVATLAQDVSATTLGGSPLAHHEAGTHRWPQNPVTGKTTVGFVSSGIAITDITTSSTAHAQQDNTDTATDACTRAFGPDGHAGPGVVPASCLLLDPVSTTEDSTDTDACTRSFGPDGPAIPGNVPASCLLLDPISTTEDPLACTRAFGQARIGGTVPASCLSLDPIPTTEDPDSLPPLPEVTTQDTPFTLWTSFLPPITVSDLSSSTSTSLASTTPQQGTNISSTSSSEQAQTSTTGLYPQNSTESVSEPVAITTTLSESNETSTTVDTFGSTSIPSTSVSGVTTLSSSSTVVPSQSDVTDAMNATMLPDLLPVTVTFTTTICLW